MVIPMNNQMITMLRVSIASLFTSRIEQQHRWLKTDGKMEKHDVFAADIVTPAWPLVTRTCVCHICTKERCWDSCECCERTSGCGVGMTDES